MILTTRFSMPVQRIKIWIFKNFNLQEHFSKTIELSFVTKNEITKTLKPLLKKYMTDDCFCFFTWKGGGEGAAVVTLKYLNKLKG